MHVTWYVYSEVLAWWPTLQRLATKYMHHQIYIGIEIWFIEVNSRCNRNNRGGQVRRCAVGTPGKNGGPARILKNPAQRAANGASVYRRRRKPAGASIPEFSGTPTFGKQCLELVIQGNAYSRDQSIKIYFIMKCLGTHSWILTTMYTRRDCVH